MSKERILVLNLGSTSSKIAVYDDAQEVFKENNQTYTGGDGSVR